MTSVALPRVVAPAFGLLMVAVAAVHAHGPALVAAAAAVTAVVAGIHFRSAATVAVVITASVIALSNPPVIFATLCGLSATAYLVLRHASAVTATRPTILGAVGFTLVGLVATAIPLHLAWLPLLAPVAALAIFVIAIRPFVGPHSH
jgi:hypothetical protein